MILGVDLDNCLNDLVGPLRERVKKELNIELPEITSYHIEDCTPLNKRQVQSFFTSEFFQSLPADFDAVEVLQRFYALGNSIWVVTDREIEHLNGTYRWLEGNGIPYTAVQLSSPFDKAYIAETRRLKRFVEDRLDTAIALAAVCERVYLIDKPWNQGDVPENVMRVSGWREIGKDLSV